MTKRNRYLSINIEKKQYKNRHCPHPLISLHFWVLSVSQPNGKILPIIMVTTNCSMQSFIQHLKVYNAISLSVII